MKVKVEPAEIWQEYMDGITYKESLDLFTTVNRNNDFVNDKQWEGVKAPNIDKPVFNVIKPTVRYFISILISDAIAVDFGASSMVDPLTGPEPEQLYDNKTVSKILHKTTLSTFDIARIHNKARQFIKNCIVDGDACFYLYYDGAINGVNIDVIDNVNVYFGDTSLPNVQRQPYIILAYRRRTSDVKETAKQHGASETDIDSIRPDTDDTFQNSELETEADFTTVLLKLWKEDGTVHAVRTTQKAVVQPETDLMYKLYPVAWMNWDSRKNSYHGISPVSGLIPNQITINKLYAYTMRYVANFAFPKVIYDEEKLPEGWNNDPNTAVAVQGDPSQAIFAGFRPPDMGNAGTVLADAIMRYTRELTGATDSALGLERPDNTSAIIAQQKASSMPLDFQRMGFHDAMEDVVRSMVDIYATDYARRYVQLDTGEFEDWFDYPVLSGYELNLSVDVGAGSYWSEVTKIQTLEKLLDKGMIPPDLYIDMIPDGYVEDRQKILEQMRMAQAAPQGAAPGMPQEAMQQVPDENVIPFPQDMGAPGEMAAEEAQAGSGLPPSALREIMSQLFSAGTPDEALAMLAQMKIDDRLKAVIAQEIERRSGQQG